MKAKIKINILLMILSFIVIFSCNEAEFLEEVPRDILSADNLYKSPEGFRNGLNAIYANVRREKEGWLKGYNGSYPFVYMTMATDNCWGNFLGKAEYPITYYKEYNNPTFRIYNDIFAWLYEIINASNTIINRAEGAKIEWESGEKETIIAEAKVFRVWAYRNLTYLWGDVPLSLKESSGSTIKLDWERTPVEQIYEQMEEDLLYASENLPDNPNTPGRIVSAVADYYLSELYLLLDDAEKAEIYARRIVDSGHYNLITQRYGVKSDEYGTPYSDQFIDGNVLRNQGNTEVIWEWLYEPDVIGGAGDERWLRNYWGMRYYKIQGVSVTEQTGGRGGGRQSLTIKALEFYENFDDRYSDAAIRWFLMKDDGDTIFLNPQVEEQKNLYWPTIKKMDAVHPDPLRIAEKPGYVDVPYLRLADVYLLLTEALHKQDKNTEAATYINLVRQRSNASIISPSEISMNFILDERSRELIGEEHRRYTLLRTNTWLSRTKSMNPISGPLITERDKLFPIPQEVIDANLNSPMTQNPGYE